MPQFKPFKGIRPTKELAQSFVTHSVDNFSKEELNSIADQNPNTFVKVIRPTWNFQEKSKEERFQMVRQNFEECLANSIVKEDKTSFYIYIQEKEDQKIKGIIGLVSIDDYNNDKIKKHEETLTPRKERFAAYIKEAEIYAEPVLLMHKKVQRIDLLTEHEIKKMPTVEFKDEQETVHKLWLVKDRLMIKQIKESVEKIDELYIADGHHRMGSSAMYTEHRRSKEKKYLGNEVFNYTLALLVDESQLVIKDFNRLVKSLNGHSKDDFLKKLDEKFIVIKKEKAYYPSKKNYISMYLGGEFYSLYIKPEFRGNPKGIGELDTYLFEEHILKPILDIHDSRNDNRIDFLAGTGDIKGIHELKEKVDSEDFEVGFGFFPICSNEIQLIADLQQKMPPKSTYIEPKLLSGLVISDLK